MEAKDPRDEIMRILGVLGHASARIENECLNGGMDGPTSMFQTAAILDQMLEWLEFHNLIATAMGAEKK